MFFCVPTTAKSAETSKHFLRVVHFLSIYQKKKEIFFKFTKNGKIFFSLKNTNMDRPNYTRKFIYVPLWIIQPLAQNHHFYSRAKTDRPITCSKGQHLFTCNSGSTNKNSTCIYGSTNKRHSHAKMTQRFLRAIMDQPITVQTCKFGFTRKSHKSADIYTTSVSHKIPYYTQL